VTLFVKECERQASLLTVFSSFLLPIVGIVFWIEFIVHLISLS